MDAFQQTFLPVYRGRVSRIQHIEYRLVVFVYQHHAPPAVPLVRLLQHVGKPLAYILEFCSSPVFLFPCADRTSYDIIQFARSCKESIWNTGYSAHSVSNLSMASPLNSSFRPWK